MVSDEKLAEHVQQYEQQLYASSDVRERLERLEENAMGVHDELARRIESTREESASTEELQALADRLTDIEERLAALEDEV